MKKQLYDSPKIKVLSFQFEAFVCQSGTFEQPGLEEGGEL
jgi:hypothetical protein